MKRKSIFIIICIIISLFCIAAVSATDNQTIGDSEDYISEKQTPIIDINTSSVYTNHLIGISLRDSNKNPILNENLTVNVDENNYSLVTDDLGKSSLKLDLKPSNYLLKVYFLGNENFTAVNNTFNINVLKLKSTISVENTTVYQYKYFYMNLKDNFANPVTGVRVSINVNKNTYESTTNDVGRAGFKISLTADAKYSLKISFSGNDYYEAVSKTISLIVPATTSIEIGNNKLLTNGYLRIYLKSPTLSAISKKTIKIKIGTKSYTKTTNSEGIVIFQPKLGANTYDITVTFAGSSTIDACNSSKTVKCIVGNVKNPLKQKISLVNGTPDIDVMPNNYVMANGDMKYTLLKAQYKEVIQRDSYTLFLKNKLSKYVFFKTKTEPKLNHIIVREKWNVIERAINTKIVKKNKYGYWPSSVTVSLKGKSYTYSEVRDVQDTGYTCGPTSASMCTQFLRNYVNEMQLARLAGSNSYDGTSTRGIKIALEKNNFKCSYYYKSSFDYAINELKKGGCALIFHTWSHYVAILDISSDGKKVLVGNPSGDYDQGSHDIPTNWLTVKYMKKMFNNYDTSGLIVRLKYSLSSSQKTKYNYIYSNMGAGWVAQNTNERIPQIQKELF